VHCDIVVRIVKTGGLGKVALYENFTWSLSNAVHCMGQNIKITCGVCVCARELGVEYLENVKK